MTSSLPLLVVFHSRDIPQFLDAVAKLKIDKLYINYYPQYAAYPLARLEFLKRLEYTHMVILADDLIVKERDLDILANECDKYDSISGWCNAWHVGPYAEDSNISYHLPPNPPNGHAHEEYHFVKIAVLDIMKEIPVKGGAPIIQVEHQGTALTFLKRELLEKVELRTDYGCCPDALLSTDLHRLGIPQYIDLRVKMLHLKHSDNPVADIVKKPSCVTFEKT